MLDAFSARVRHRSSGQLSLSKSSWQILVRLQSQPIIDILICGWAITIKLVLIGHCKAISEDLAPNSIAGPGNRYIKRL